VVELQSSVSDSLVKIVFILSFCSSATATTGKVPDLCSELTDIMFFGDDYPGVDCFFKEPLTSLWFNLRVLDGISSCPGDCRASLALVFEESIAICTKSRLSLFS
jgi:hypothetical protein